MFAQGKKSKYQPAVCTLHNSTPSSMKLRKTRNTIFCGFYVNLTFPLLAPQRQVLCWPQIPACVTAGVAAASIAVSLHYLISAHKYLSNTNYTHASLSCWWIIYGRSISNLSHLSCSCTFGIESVHRYCSVILFSLRSTDKYWSKDTL